ALKAAAMPIRFRCQHCKQLLGIARRKAGTHVNCPTCRRQVMVPDKDEDEPNQPAPSPAEVQQVPAKAQAQEQLFERDDFAALLRPPPSLAPGVASAAPLPAPAPSNRPAPRNEAEPAWQGEGETAGLVLSPARATLLTVGVILLLAVAFGAGLLVGRF